MSRNLGNGRVCYFCGAEVVKLGQDHPITKNEAGAYFDEYAGMVVSDAECPDCETQYLAWVCGERRTACNKYPTVGEGEDWDEIRDLSFRSTFDDEPGPEDMPKYVIRTVRQRALVEQAFGPKGCAVLWTSLRRRELITKSSFSLWRACFKKAADRGGKS